jgi:hypothetical protein
MKILFVMDHRVDRGSIHSVANYVRAGDELGHHIALYGRADSRFPAVRFSTDVGVYDYVVFLVESWRYWMSGLRMPRLLQEIPRNRRAIVDADGMYNQIVSVDGYDRNYVYEEERQEWLGHYRLVADKIFQPSLAPREPGVMALPFYGYAPSSQIAPAASPPKRYDLLHVGHNWWRWREMSQTLLPAIERVRGDIGTICFIGSWWDAVPAGAKDLNLELAFGLDVEWLRRLRVEAREAVPYTDVVRVMSEGRVNIMTQRPLFQHLKILTAKYFEIFAADTIPLVVLDPDQAELVYGPAGRDLVLADKIDEKLMDVLRRPEAYRAVVDEVRRHLAAHHSYAQRVGELVAALIA